MLSADATRVDSRVPSTGRTGKNQEEREKVTELSEALPQTDEACNPFVDAGLRPWSSALDASLRGAAPRRKKLDSLSTDFRKGVTLARMAASFDDIGCAVFKSW